MKKNIKIFGFFFMFLLWLFTFLPLFCNCFIDPMKHDIHVYTKDNFVSKVQKYRDYLVFIIYAYKNSAAEEKFIKNQLNTLATDLQGMINVGVVSCNDWEEFCADSAVKSVPSVLIYPPQPFPPFQYTGKMENNLIKKAALAHIPASNVRIVTNENVDFFLSENPSIPKVLLFSEKPKSLPLYNALANTFLKKLSLGFVAAKDEKSNSVVSKFSVKSFPHILIVKTDKKSEAYKGEIKYRKIHDWLNIFAEQFVTGGGYTDTEPTANTKPWIGQKVPEVTRASHQEICFKKGKGLCVIYLTFGKQLSSEELRMLEQLQSEFTSHVSDRGINFRWMWMDLKIENGFAEMLQIAQYPSVVVFNPLKRLRYTKIETEATKDEIETLLNKIAGGDARFTNVPNQELPAFANREVPPAKKSKEEL